jgi:hypothetical protein
MGAPVRVIVANHKTGTMLMLGLAREYCEIHGLKHLVFDRYLRDNGERIDPAHDFQSYDVISINHAVHFTRLIDAVPGLAYRALHLVRNPYEIIMSGVRYHQVAREEWSDKKLFVADEDGPCGYRRIGGNETPDEACCGQFSYREIICLLSPERKIEFEIRQSRRGFNTIPCIRNFLRRFKTDRDVATIRLEDVATEACIAFVFAFLDLRREFVPAWRRKTGSKSWLGRHVTNGRGETTYADAFTPRLYAAFDEEFRPNALRDFGYDPPPEPEEIVAGYREALARIGASLALEETTFGDDLDAAAGDAKALSALGERCLREFRFDAAKAAFAACVGLDGGRPGTLGKLAHVLFLQADYDSAVACYRRIVAASANPPVWAYVGLGNAFAASRRPAEAVVAFEQAVPLIEAPERLQAAIERLRAEAL